MPTEPLTLATENAVTFWTAVGEARGYALVRRPGFLAVAGDERAGLRVLTLVPDLSGAELSELIALARDQRGGRVVVEDAYGTVDMSPLGLGARQLPVMIRYPGEPLPEPALKVERVTSLGELRTAERIVVDGFALEHFQPYQPGVVFPDAILDRVELFVATIDGEPAGACLAIQDASAVGIYWVTTMPQYRSRGVARTIMHAVLRRYDTLPMTLTASRLGRPLYESLGFQKIVDATWWA
ncbi:GNAT family N-acetyltransferase [Dactylosporangium sp. AC04546]|uniref:GNAT family N-acetyltransferase n=1 Tax=Dactylosporangium sp. AC04546 TaxID=2862460 RepID=UPI001EE061A7|nr:GNAT family N-acetyltransferase [Dactylosporangium sp. AC04546]WVK87582.1 GNAT family N-acetyltransferase [Dactylosporangium sp. AC04546]